MLYFLLPLTILWSREYIWVFSIVLLLSWFTKLISPHCGHSFEPMVTSGSQNVYIFPMAPLQRRFKLQSHHPYKKDIRHVTTYTPFLPPHMQTPFKKMVKDTAWIQHVESCEGVFTQGKFGGGKELIVLIFQDKQAVWGLRFESVGRGRMSHYPDWIRCGWSCNGEGEFLSNNC